MRSNSKAKSNGLRNRTRKPQGSARRSAATNPPQLNTNVVLHHRFRYKATAAIVAVGITPTNILGALGGVCSVVDETLAYTNKTFKLKSVNIWAPTATSTTPVTCSVEWLGLGNSPNLETSDTSVNQSQPARLQSRPPEGSLASFWQLASASTLFVLNCPIGSIVDVSFDYVQRDEGTAATIAGLVAGTLGVLYYLALDGHTTNLLVPISLNTTA